MKQTAEDPIIWSIVIGLALLSVSWLFQGYVIAFAVTATLALASLAWSKKSNLKGYFQRHILPASKADSQPKDSMPGLQESLAELVASAKADPFFAGILLLSSMLLLFSFFDYARDGYSLRFLVCWSSGIVFLLAFLWRKSCQIAPFSAGFEKGDVYTLVVLSLIFGVIYLSMPASYPIQMNSDEIAIRNQIREMTYLQPPINPLGPSHYFGFPAFVHLLLGRVANLLGGITINHLRSAHAFFGLLCVIFSFVFYRTLGLTRTIAVFATCILGFNHSFLTISRLVSQNATSPLLEVIALALLYRGTMKKSSFLSCAGGIAAGAAFYVHPPARIIIFIFLLAYGLYRISTSKAKGWFYDLLPVAIGFTIATFPMLWTTLTAPKDLFTYQHGQFLPFPEGRKIETAQVWAKSELEGVWINIQQGLLAFNYPIHDNSNIYLNYGFGFVDPLTGALIWIGLLYLLIEWKERADHRWADILCITGFLFLWLAFSFIITFAPSYTRLTITLPFVAYLAVHGLLAITYALQYCASELPLRWQKVLSRLTRSHENLLKDLFMEGMVALIIVLNINSLWKFTREAQTQGDRGGATFRIVEKLAGDKRWHVLVSGDNHYQYFWEGDNYENIAWTDNDDMPDRVFVIPPEKLKSELRSGKLDESFKAPFVLFLTTKLWLEVRSDFESKNPVYETKNIIPDGSLCAIVVN